MEFLEVFVQNGNHRKGTINGAGFSTSYGSFKTPTGFTKGADTDPINISFEKTKTELEAISSEFLKTPGTWLQASNVDIEAPFYSPLANAAKSSIKTDITFVNTCIDFSTPPPAPPTTPDSTPAATPAASSKDTVPLNSAESKFQIITVFGLLSFF